MIKSKFVSVYDNTAQEYDVTNFSKNEIYKLAKKLQKKDKEIRYIIQAEDGKKYLVKESDLSTIVWN